MAYTRISGIYVITCERNGKVYVGRSLNVKSRFEKHRRHLRNGNHWNKALQSDYNDFGRDAFRFEIIYEAQQSVTGAELDEIERRYIEEYSSYLSGYNETLGGTGNLGKVFTESARRNMSTVRKGKKKSAEMRAKLSVARKKKVAIGDVVYLSVSDAAEATGFNYGTLRSRIYSPNYPDYRFA